MTKYYVALAFLLALLVGACDFNPGEDRSGCDGYPEFIRTLPDTVLSVSSNPLIIEIEGDNPVARHTGGHGFHFRGGSSDPEIANAYVTGYQRRNVLLVTPLSPGVTAVGLIVSDFCDKTDNLAFTVTVTASE